MSIFVRVFGIVSEDSKRKMFNRINENLEKRKGQIKKRVDADSPNCCLFFIDYSDFDIPIGTEFLYFIDPTNFENTIRINGRLTMVTQNFGILYENIPSGHKTMCQICFDDVSFTTVTDRLAVQDGWYIPQKTYLFSTTPKLG